MQIRPQWEDFFLKLHSYFQEFSYSSFLLFVVIVFILKDGKIFQLLQSKCFMGMNMFGIYTITSKTTLLMVGTCGQKYFEYLFKLTANWVVYLIDCLFRWVEKAKWGETYFSSNYFGKVQIF